MNDFVTSLIRTYVPIGVAWLIGVGVLPSEMSDTAVATATAAIFGAYYLAVRALEKRWPFFGWFLGAAKPPTYS